MKAELVKARDALKAAEGRIAVLERDGRRLLAAATNVVIRVEAVARYDHGAKELRAVIDGVSNGPLGMVDVPNTDDDSAHAYWALVERIEQIGAEVDARLKRAVRSGDQATAVRLSNAIGPLLAAAAEIYALKRTADPR